MFFISRLLDVVELEEHVGLVTELADTDLATVMDSYEGGMPESIAKVWIYQILLGLAYCHTNNIWHRDIKPGYFD